MKRAFLVGLIVTLAAVDGCSSTTIDTWCAGLSLSGACVTSAMPVLRVRVNGAWTTLRTQAVTLDYVDAASVEIGATAPASTGGTIEAFELTLTGLQGASMLQEGYQSWSFAGAVTIPTSVPTDPDGSIATTAATTGSSADEVTGVSYGATVIGDPGARALAIATTDSTIASTAIAATRPATSATTTANPASTTVTIVYGAAREPLPVDSAGNATMPPILVTLAPRANDVLAKVTSTIAAALPKPTRTPLRPEGGWFSWNELFDAVTEPDVRGNAAIAKTRLFPHGMNLVEIDDGWEGPWGDWRVNAKFPSGMGGVASAITASGGVPGVWLAPFLVELTSATAASTDPSLFVQGADGKPLVHKPFGSTRNFYVLDGSSAAAMAVVGTQIAALRDDGFTFFKLDYLYAAALPGARSVAGVTGTQALRMGLTTLRSSMGDAAVFNACGAPIFPLLGLADSLRIGSDTAYSGLSLNWSAIVFAARGTAARAFLFPIVWPDGDQAQVRAPYDDGEARASAFVAALSGPAFSLGDDLTKLSADRFSIVDDAALQDLAQASAPALANDPLESPAAQIVLSPILDTIAAPGSTTAPPPTTFVGHGRSGASYTLTFSWTDTHSVAVVTNTP
ncbi:MAG: hypothetical protein ACHREM_14720 [Polyangiales bacterium]